ncbi:MAG: response regulator transcription factor [Chloroflexi bacterium]|nr:response regulator transcription factor [Chloroflexota bacterium]
MKRDDQLPASRDERTERILVVDDEKTIRTVIAEALQSFGYRVQTASNADLALKACLAESFDLALVDMRMPGSMDGMGLLGEMHRQWPEMVVILLTAFASLDSAITALRQGAYDYLVKPVSLAQIKETVERGLAKRREQVRRQELIARLEETMKELKRETRVPSVDLNGNERFVQTSTLMMDRQKRIVVRGAQEIALTATEFDLLDYMLRNCDRVISASELIRAVQGYDLIEVDARPILRVHIQRLRQKLEDDLEHPRYVLNVRGKGYRFAG